MPSFCSEAYELADDRTNGLAAYKQSSFFFVQVLDGVIVPEKTIDKVRIFFQSAIFMKGIASA